MAEGSSDAYALWDSLADHVFYKFQPSVVAAACVGASRICLQLSPYWTRDLQRISSYSLEHLGTCIELLLVYVPLSRSSALPNTEAPQESWVIA